jgi:transposase
MTSEEALQLLVETLKEQLQEQIKTVTLQTKTISSQTRVIEELGERIKELQSQIAWFKRQYFGRKSEKLQPIDPGQLNLQFDGIDFKSLDEEIQKARNEAKEQIADKEKASVKDNVPAHRNRKMLQDLPVIEEIIEPEKPVDITIYKKIGEEHTRTLEFIPGRIYIKDIVRIKYGLRNPESIIEKGKGVLIAKMPLMPIYKGLPGASLLAEVLLQKYEYHMPFYRQMKELRHLGIEISDRTVDGWFNPVCKLLKPLYLELKKAVLSSNYIQVDETTIPVINHEAHKASKEYLWLVRSVMKHLAFFHYDEGSRSQETAMKLLKPFKGYLQSDGYIVYDAFEKKEGVCLVGCLAHIRRDIEESKVENKQYALEGLKQIQDLYSVEHIADRDGLSYEERAALRQKLSEPILNGFELWLEKTYPHVLKKSRMGKAIAYAYQILPRMRPYLKVGYLKIDNNAAENVIRPITVSRKNFLFCGNDNAAENMTVISSLLASCKDCNVNPREYLNDVIARMPYYLESKSELDIRELLPDKWTADPKRVQKNPTEVQQLYAVLANAGVQV